MTDAPSQPDRYVLAGKVRARAREMGFDLVGIAPASPSQYRDYFRRWLDDGQAGTMRYLHSRFDERTDPSRYLGGAKSVICLAINYHVPLEPVPPEAAAQHGRIARYALGDDYHEVFKPRLHALADWLRQLCPDAQTRCAVDTAPVMEKELAARAGIGWLGKNTCLINTQLGSWLLLGEIITTLELAPEEPAIDRCGTCRRCIDACPAAAITAPYQLDARRCISYLTIEHRGEIAPEFRSAIGNWLYGCDICQEVCPWNRKAPASGEVAFRPRLLDGSIRLDDVLAWGDEEYRVAVRRSAMRRVKLPVLQRNAAMIRSAASAEAGG